MTDLLKERQLARDIANIVRIAGEIITAAHNVPAHQKEGHYNFVTDADVAVQEFLKEELRRLLPGSRFFAEEQDNAALTDAHTWVVDPIDGTLNFMRGRRCSSVSVGLLRGKAPVVGVIFNPYQDEMFTAVKGGGAYCNGRPIGVSDTPFDKALTEMGTSPYNAALVPATAHCFAEFMKRGGDIRRSGSAAIDFCSVACGRSDVFFEFVLSPWDFAAGSLIVTEAGGAFLMPFLDAADYSQPAATLCANQRCIAPALAIVREAGALLA